jgi:hypothetical protein
MLGRFIAVAAVLALPIAGPAQAQIRLEPDQAMRCAVWASIMAASSEEKESQDAFAYALHYFIGQYEGASDQSISSDFDEEAIVNVAENLEAYSPVCAGSMIGFGTRMQEWGRAMTELGTRLEIEEAARAGN